MSLIITVLAVAALFLFFGYRESQKREKQELAERVTRITKHFGNVPVSLFRFNKDNEREGGSPLVCAWVLIAFDSRRDDIADLKSHKENLLLDKCYDETQLQKKEQSVQALCAMLPYNISTIDANIPLNEYRDAVRL